MLLLLLHCVLLLLLMQQLALQLFRLDRVGLYRFVLAVRVRFRRRVRMGQLVRAEQSPGVAAYLHRTAGNTARPVPLGQPADGFVAPQEPIVVEDDVVRVEACLHDLEIRRASVLKRNEIKR